MHIQIFIIWQEVGFILESIWKHDYRSHLANFNSIFRKLEKKLPYHFNCIKIDTTREDWHFSIDKKYNFNIQTAQLGANVLFGGVQQFGILIASPEDSQTETFRKLVDFYLNRPGTSIHTLQILNHPYGLEACCQLNIRHIFVRMRIESLRYDYTTWFDCLRARPFETAEVDFVGMDYLILAEPVIYSAKKLCIKSSRAIPIRAISNLQSPWIFLDYNMTSPKVVNLCENWIQDKKTDGHHLDTFRVPWEVWAG